MPKEEPFEYPQDFIVLWNCLTAEERKKYACMGYLSAKGAIHALASIVGRRSNADPS